MNMTTRTQGVLTRAGGGSLGLVLAVLLLVAARPGASVPGLPATVRVTVPVQGELALAPAPPRPILMARSLRPGGPRSSARFELRNQTGRTMKVGFRATPDSPVLDGLLRVRLAAGGTLLADTTLQGMRHGTEPGLRLASGARTRVRLSVWIPAGLTAGYEGRIVDVSLLPVITYGRG